MIPFTQFLMPDGRIRDGGFKRSAEIEKMAAEVLDTGGRFTSEMLSTGEISIAYEKQGEDQDVEVDVVKNGPEVLDAYRADKPPARVKMHRLAKPLTEAEVVDVGDAAIIAIARLEHEKAVAERALFTLSDHCDDYATKTYMGVGEDYNCPKPKEVYEYYLTQARKELEDDNAGK